MCKIAYRVDTNEPIESIADMRCIAPRIVWSGQDGSHLSEDNCLCWVDVERTLLDAGFKVWFDRNSIPDVLCEKATAEEEQADD